MASYQKQWSKNHESCIRCRTQERSHKAKGLCIRCYTRETELKQKSHRTRNTRKLERKIDLGEIDYMYNVLNYSLNDIAKKFNCTRQYIYKIMNRHGIKTRDKSSARRLALEKEKLIFQTTDKFGISNAVKLKRTVVNRKFFKSWSPGMAYVLGLLYTDGYLYPGRVSARQKIQPHFRLGQKEPELLEKVLSIMGCDSKIYFGPKRSITGELYTFQISDQDMYKDLLRLGLAPRKSRTLEFPKIPSYAVRHFIRGCWDGDGSVYLEKNNLNRPRASFISGSKKFVEGILTALESFGLPKRKIYAAEDGKSFYFRFSGKRCLLLYNIFYYDVPETMYLERKYKLFKKVANHYARRQNLWPTAPIISIL